MKSKIIKRSILIFLISSMVFSFIGYKYGFIKNFLMEKSTDTTSSASITKDNKDGTNINDKLDDVVKRPISEVEKIDPKSGQSLVSIVQSNKMKVEQISSEEIRDMVHKAINLAGGFKGIIKDNQVVVLKPNLVQMHVDSTGELFDKELNGATTDWRVTKAVVEMVREYNPNGKVYVMEGSAGDGTRKTMEYLNYTHDKIPGVDDFIALEEDSGGWQEFNSKELIEKSLPKGLLNKKYYLNKIYSACDVLISIPCLKTNSGTVVSGSIKNVSIGATPANIYGVSATNPGRTQMVSHKIIDGEMDKWLYDYYMCKPVNFVVMDGLQGFQNGPVPIGKSNIVGDRMNMRLIMAGSDAIAVDTIEALIMGWDPESIPYLRYLSDSGFGKIGIPGISVIGNLVDEVRKNFKIKFTNLGGSPIQDKKPPALEIIRQELLNDMFKLSLNTGEDTVKVEVFVDDKLYLTPSPESWKDIAIDISKLSKNDHSVKVLSYDRFMNHSEVKTSFMSKVSSINGSEYFSKKNNLVKAQDIEGLITLSKQGIPSNPSSYSDYYELPKQIIKLAHDKAMEKFKSGDNYAAAIYTEYGLAEYMNIYLNKPLTHISLEDITVKSEEKYANMKISSSEFILIFNNYAYFIALTGDDSKAESLLKKVIELSPDRAVAYIDLGNVSWNLGKKEDAKRYYKRYLELLGNNTKNVPKEVYERIKE